MMEIKSKQMGRNNYRRNRIELLLCESVAGRELQKKDAFFHGQMIFDLADDGFSVFKEFGRQGG